jgi:hypothetical protein
MNELWARRWSIGEEKKILRFEGQNKLARGVL